MRIHQVVCELRLLIVQSLTIGTTSFEAITPKIEVVNESLFKKNIVRYYTLTESFKLIFCINHIQ